MPKENLEYIDREKFRNEIDIMILKLQNLKRETEAAKEYEVDGEIPMFNQPTWRRLYTLGEKIENFYRKSWGTIKSNHAAKSGANQANGQIQGNA